MNCNVRFIGTTIGPSNVDSARQNLASSFVNGFVNAAFGQDKLLMEEGNKWLYKNKEHGTFIIGIIRTGRMVGSLFAFFTNFPKRGSRCKQICARHSYECRCYYWSSRCHLTL